MCKDTVVMIRKMDPKKFFKLVNEYRPNKVNLEDIMSSYCNKQSKIMIIGEWKMNVVAIIKLIYMLKVSTFISSNKIWGSILTFIKNSLVSWFDDKELSLEANVKG